MSGLRLKDGVHLNTGRDIPRRRHGVITEVEILTIYTTKSTHDSPPGVFSPVCRIGRAVVVATGLHLKGTLVKPKGFG
jgi:hypothetical protein